MTGYPLEFNRFNTQVGSRLTDIRKSLHLTQEDVAKKFNRSRQFISEIELGTIRINLDMLVLFSEIYQTDIIEFFPEDRPLFPQKNQYDTVMEQAEPYNSEDDTLSGAELTELLNNYCSVTQRQRLVVRDYLKTLVETNAKS